MPTRAARWLLLFLVFALAPITARAANAGDAQRFFELNMGDLKAELAEAARDGRKGVLVVFEQEGCPACRHMHTRVFNRRDVQDFYRAHFATVALDVHSAVPVKDFQGREQTEKEYALSARVRGTPTFVFHDPAGKEVVRIVGPIETPEEFLLLGRFVASGAYRTRTFAQYKHEKPTRRGS